jgi:hypothetical protein
MGWPPAGIGRAIGARALRGTIIGLEVCTGLTGEPLDLLRHRLAPYNRNSPGGADK